MYQELVEYMNIQRQAAEMSKQYALNSSYALGLSLRAWSILKAHCVESSSGLSLFGIRVALLKRLPEGTDCIEIENHERLQEALARWE